MVWSTSAIDVGVVDAKSVDVATNSNPTRRPDSQNIFGTGSELLSRSYPIVSFTFDPERGRVAAGASRVGCHAGIVARVLGHEPADGQQAGERVYRTDGQLEPRGLRGRGFESSDKVKLVLLLDGASIFEPVEGNWEVTP